MPGFQNNEPGFPAVDQADASGLLAIGGDLSTERLLLAYSSGIFPWYEEPYPVLWWSPDPRMVLFPRNIKVSQSLRQSLKNHPYEIRIDTSFYDVINYCATTGNRVKDGTWITDEMIKAYTSLHDEGYAHSIETWLHGELVGGLYGLSLGRAFFGESMFFIKPDTSKIALLYLASLMQELRFEFIDVQQETNHLKSLGAVSIRRATFIELLKNAIKYETIKGKWTNFGCRNYMIKQYFS